MVSASKGHMKLRFQPTSLVTSSINKTDKIKQNEQGQFLTKENVLECQATATEKHIYLYPD